MRLRVFVGVVALTLALSIAACAAPITSQRFALTGPQGTLTGTFFLEECNNPVGHGLYSYIYAFDQIPQGQNRPTDLNSFRVFGFNGNQIYVTADVDTRHGPGDGAGQWPKINLPDGILFQQTLNGQSNGFAVPSWDTNLVEWQFCIPCPTPTTGLAVASLLDNNGNVIASFSGAVPVPGGCCAPVPEPGTMGLLALGLAPLGMVVRRRKLS